jgi:HEPN domain-containing protein
MNDNVSEWVSKAENDYGSAAHERGRGEEANFDLICFLCQQCIEKLMKAVLIQRRLDAPKTHNLVTLNALLAAAIPDWKGDLDELNDLSLGAVDYRYPGESAEVPDAEWAFTTASSLRSRLREILGLIP